MLPLHVDIIQINAIEEPSHYRIDHPSEQQYGIVLEIKENHNKHPNKKLTS